MSAQIIPLRPGIQQCEEVNDENEKLQCPFVYATGKQCKGHVTFAKGFGPWRDGVVWAKKVRLWCSEKGSHEGGTRSWAGKERMEFYPDKLPTAIRDRVMPRFAEGFREFPL